MVSRRVDSVSPNEKFDFLGYTFQPRRSKNRKGKFFINFSPAVSNKAAKAIRDQFRSWKLPQRSDKAIEDLSRMFNPSLWRTQSSRREKMAKRKTSRNKKFSKKSKCDFLCGRLATIRIGRLNMCDECASAPNEAPPSEEPFDHVTRNLPEG